MFVLLASVSQFGGDENAAIEYGVIDELERSNGDFPFGVCGKWLVYGIFKRRFTVCFVDSWCFNEVAPWNLDVVASYTS